MNPQELEAAGVRTLILVAPDMQGRLFGRRMPLAQFFERADGIEVCTCALAWDVGQELGVNVDFAGFQTGWHDFRLAPDLSMLRLLGWHEGMAVCFADVVEPDGTPVRVAPRNILKRQVERLRDLGYEASVGSELEFFLYATSYDDAQAQDYRGLKPSTRYHADYLVSPGNLLAGFFDRLRDGAERTGVGLELEQGEWGLGQWELNMRHGPALQTADHHTLFKMAVKEVAQLEGMSATFMARPSTEEIGSSGHLHVSLRTLDGAPAFHDAGAERRLSPAYRHAVGGVLAHAAELMPWYAPTINSYRRVARDELVAGSGATWGYDNRTTSIRTVGQSPDALRMEFRLCGADNVAHLSIAAVLASIADGIERGLDPGDPVTGNAYETEREPLPEDLREASRTFRASAFARAAFGDDVVDHYAAVADFEWKQFMAQVTDWEIRRYYEQA
jgi:glutamine synthetase